MGKAAYPTGAELAAYLVAAGFTSAFVAALDTTTFAAAGASEFEREAGRRMLAVTQTREFDPCRVGTNGFLDLKADLASLTSVAWNTTAYTVGTDVRAFPLNAADDGLPYSGLSFGYWRRFSGYGYPFPPLISVAGDWGYGATIPEDAWAGMLAFAGMLLFPQIVQRRTGGMFEWTEADMREAYGNNPLQGLRAGWQAITLATAGGLTDQGKRVWGKYARIPM